MVNVHKSQQYNGNCFTGLILIIKVISQSVRCGVKDFVGVQVPVHSLTSTEKRTLNDKLYQILKILYKYIAPEVDGALLLQTYSTVSLLGCNKCLKAAKPGPLECEVWAF